MMMMLRESVKVLSWDWRATGTSEVMEVVTHDLSYIELSIAFFYVFVHSEGLFYIYIYLIFTQ